MTPSSSGIPAAETAEWVAPLAQALVEALPRLYGHTINPSLAELITALTLALERGALDLPLAGPPPPGIEPEGWPERHGRALRHSRLAAEGEGPLVLEGEVLRWRRWHERRRSVLERLVGRLAAPVPANLPSPPPMPLPQPTATTTGSVTVTTTAMPTVGSPRIGAQPLDPLQRQAVEAVFRHGLVLLEGGPGTGKTTTVAAMVTTVLARLPTCRIQLAAPTGKAAARLRAATGGSIPCVTLHRLLEYRGGMFGRDRNHPLALDLLVVDELSMVDMTLMEALLEALPPECRLVLVGDPHQLPPVSPGPVLAELQRAGWRQALGGAAITLRTTHRNNGAISAVAAALRDVGSTDDPLVAILPLLERLPPGANLRWQQASAGILPGSLLDELADRQRRLAALAVDCGVQDGPGARAVLRELERQLLLVPFRRGRWGLEAIHAALLGERSSGPPSSWPIGTPVLCNRNLPELGLANGDLGVVVASGSPDGERRLLFGSGGDHAEGGNDERSGALDLWLHPALLAGAVQPALALTVHKAQGSEAERVIVLVPSAERLEPALLYTALTRARRSALLITPRGEGRHG
jgi:exodeoxyribonuclease V alpha subunit